MEEEADEDDENTWGDEGDDENTLFDMDEFVLQESTGYMLPALRFLAIFHTVISLVCLVGYYCLKVHVTVPLTPRWSACTEAFWSTKTSIPFTFRFL